MSICTLSGGGGIRTHGTRERSTVFKTAPINRSGTPPVCLIVVNTFYMLNALCQDLIKPELVNILFNSIITTKNFEL